MDRSPIKELKAVRAEGRNSQVVELTDRDLAIYGDSVLEAQIIRAYALFDLHRVEDAMNLALQLRSTYGNRPEIVYALARLHYQKNDHQEAERLAREILAMPGVSQEFETRANLVIGNVQVDENRTPEAIETLDRISKTIASASPALRTTYEVLLGQAAAKRVGPGAARQPFYDALRIAAMAGDRRNSAIALYHLARVAHAESNSAELRIYADLFGKLVSLDQFQAMGHWFNREFSEFGLSVTKTIEFDDEHMRIRLGDETIAFHDKHLIYQFLRTLHQRGNFVEKEALATALWPGESYDPRIHDPRIFDIAKRTRKIIEKFDQMPVVLLSGRLGYKLATESANQNRGNQERRPDEPSSQDIVANSGSSDSRQF